jgi:hypothetical protein
VLYGRGSCKTKKNSSRVGKIGGQTNLQHRAIDYDFTLGITIIIGV